jgi:hypothetical protein
MMSVSSTLIRVLSTGYSSIKYNVNWQILARLSCAIEMKIVGEKEHSSGLRHRRNMRRMNARRERKYLFFLFCSGGNGIGNNQIAHEQANNTR